MRTVTLAAVTACVLLLLACGGAEEKPSAPAKPAAPAPAPAKPAPPAQPAAPAKPAAAAPRYACLDGDVARGKAVYTQYCATCHGVGGNGEGPAAAGLNPKPAKHTDGGYMNALSNEHLHKVIAQGGGAVGKSPLMTPWGGVLSKDQIGDVVAFIRSLAKPAYACP